MRKQISVLVFLLCGVFAAVRTASAQTWTPIKNPPSVSISNCLLLTDGSVICQSGGSWLKLSPDARGSYVNGTWSQIGSLPAGYVPDAYASAVLADGRALVVGGEYNNGNFVLTNASAVYDPKADTWRSVAPPADITYVGDAPACVLEDGRFLIGSKLDRRMAVLDPATMLWTSVNQTGKIDGINSEEGWTLLPDGSIFTLDVQNAPASERFIPATATWVSAGNTPVDLHTPTTSAPLTVAPGVIYYPPGEIGPTLRRPDGTVFVVGATGQTAIFTPPPDNSTGPGSWVLGPHFPSGLNIEDGPAAVLPNGHVLTVASPGAEGHGLEFFEFDGTSLISVPTVAGADSDATYITSLLVLPTGQVMFVDGSTTVEIYTSTGTYDPSWAPTVTDVPPTVSRGATYQIVGTGFNGLTQATAYGDESQNATNYPLVRITNRATGHVFYARTHDHSSMGVATGSTLVGTYFDVPPKIELGVSTVAVVTNGIPSTPVRIRVNRLGRPNVKGVSPSGGPVSGGTSVSISGANFTAGATVKMGGTPATIVAITANTIMATTPAHAAGSVTVVVTNTDGRLGSRSKGFTYR